MDLSTAFYLHTIYIYYSGGGGGITLYVCFVHEAFYRRRWLGAADIYG